MAWPLRELSSADCADLLGIKQGRLASKHMHNKTHCDLGFRTSKPGQYLFVSILFVKRMSTYFTYVIYSFSVMQHMSKTHMVILVKNMNWARIQLNCVRNT